MTSGEISGFVGGVTTIVVLTYTAGHVGKATIPGQLRFGAFMWVLGVACLAFPLIFTALATLEGVQKQLPGVMVLFIIFAVGAIYSFSEAALVRGTFDEEGIAFSTPWTGLKREKWKDLVAFEHNAPCSWYTLTFRSGSKIRLSQYLDGHAQALQKLVDASSIPANGA